MGQLQKFTKLLLKQSQSNFGNVSIPKDPNIVLNYEKAKYFDVTFRDKSGLNEQKSRSGMSKIRSRVVVRSGLPGKPVFGFLNFQTGLKPVFTI